MYDFALVSPEPSENASPAHSLFSSASSFLLLEFGSYCQDSPRSSMGESEIPAFLNEGALGSESSSEPVPMASKQDIPSIRGMAMDNAINSLQERTQDKGAPIIFTSKVDYSDLRTLSQHQEPSENASPAHSLFSSASSFLLLEFGSYCQDSPRSSMGESEIPAFLNEGALGSESSSEPVPMASKQDIAAIRGMAMDNAIHSLRERTQDKGAPIIFTSKVDYSDLRTLSQHQEPFNSVGSSFMRQKISVSS